MLASSQVNIYPEIEMKGIASPARRDGRLQLSSWSATLLRDVCIFMFVLTFGSQKLSGEREATHAGMPTLVFADIRIKLVIGEEQEI